MIHFAEDVLPGHPDRLADVIAETIVDEAVSIDPYALVGVEVAINLDRVFITGRIATSKTFSVDLQELVQGIYQRAGYMGRWNLKPKVDNNALIVSELQPEERAIRGYADDQNIVVGYAWNDPASGYLSPAVFVARQIRFELTELYQQEPGLFGPDGKILVWIEEEGDSLGWKKCNVVIQHTKETSYLDFYTYVAPLIEQIDIVGNWDPALLSINGGGDFVQGGPLADNGLSGKKLVVDHYGPGVPIGGGALCGKDPHKIDKLGPLRSRQIAISLVKSTRTRETWVWLGYLPGQRKPEILIATIEGETWSEEKICRNIHVPDLSIEGTFNQLNLGEVRWSEVLQQGYFGNGWNWER